jgi:hypothetical protein
VLVGRDGLRIRESGGSVHGWGLKKGGNLRPF